MVQLRLQVDERESSGICGTGLKNITKRFIKYIKDRTECFDDHFHCRKPDCDRLAAAELAENSLLNPYGWNKVMTFLVNGLRLTLTLMYFDE